MRTVKISAAMARRFKNSARVCPNPDCGQGMLKYPGRYPGKCPQCDTPLKAAKEESMTTDSHIRSLIVEISSAQMLPSAAASQALGVNDTERNAKIVQRAMAKITRIGLLDCFVAHDIDPNGTNLKLYFSQAAKRGQLNTLVQELSEMSIRSQDTPEIARPQVGLYQSDQEGASYVILVSIPVAQNPQVSGDLAVSPQIAASA